MERKSMNKEYNFTDYTDGDLAYFLYTLQLRKCIVLENNSYYDSCPDCKCKQSCDEMDYIELCITKEIEKRAILAHMEMRGLLKK